MPRLLRAGITRTTPPMWCFSPARPFTGWRGSCRLRWNLWRTMLFSWRSRAEQFRAHNRPVFPRRGLAVSHEQLAEIAGIQVTDFLGDLGNGQVAGLQQFARLGQADIAQVFQWCDAG